MLVQRPGIRLCSSANIHGRCFDLPALLEALPWQNSTRAAAEAVAASLIWTGFLASQSPGLHCIGWRTYNSTEWSCIRALHTATHDLPQARLACASSWADFLVSARRHSSSCSQGGCGRCPHVCSQATVFGRTSCRHRAVPSPLAHVRHGVVHCGVDRLFRERPRPAWQGISSGEALRRAVAPRPSSLPHRSAHGLLLPFRQVPANW